MSDTAPVEKNKIFYSQHKNELLERIIRHSQYSQELGYNLAVAILTDAGYSNAVKHLNKKRDLLAVLQESSNIPFK